MSENIEPAAPQSTQDIAASVIQEAETHDSAPVETSAPETTQTETKAPDAQMSAAEELLREAGYTPKRIDGRDNLIPWSRVAKIIEKGITEGRGDFGQKYQKLTTDHDTVSKEAAELRAFRENFLAAVKGPEADFISGIAEFDPRYARYLQQQAAAQAQPAAVDDPEPGPDLELGEGRRTYSLDGLKKREEWLLRQMDRKVEERFKPYAEREKAEKERAQAEQWESDRVERARSNVAELQSKPEFGPIAVNGVLTEFQQAVLNELRADSEAAAAANRKPTMSHLEAYYKVRADRLAVDHNAVREKVIKELQGAPKSTAVGRTGAEVTRQPGPRATRDIVQQVIAEAGQ